MNEQIFIILAEESERGGLFDIGATLPLVAIQFLMLMFILNLILYNPLISLMNQRNEYLFDNLNKASEMLLTATDLTKLYEEKLELTRREAKQEIIELQKLQKESFTIALSISQKQIDSLIQEIVLNLTTKKQTVLQNINTEITSLMKKLIEKLLKN
jgi:F-type H+-transporting ATPase subunit b